MAAANSRGERGPAGRAAAPAEALPPAATGPAAGLATAGVPAAAAKASELNGFFRFAGADESRGASMALAWSRLSPRLVGARTGGTSAATTAVARASETVMSRGVMACRGFRVARWRSWRRDRQRHLRHPKSTW
ncbi:MAG: hypothetical protein C0502_04205 [Opitutus sp.]|nr:hypothetical protein [Opitutus sp.]